MNISVAMTTYKSKTYVKEQLESIFCQTRLPDEIVICDDASPDDTVEYLEKIVKSAPKEIHIVIHKNIKNLGYQRNFEGCIKKCHGDVLFLCDADDVWDIQKIEKVMNVFERDDDVVMCFHDAFIIDGDGKKTGDSVNIGWDKRNDKTNSIELARMELMRTGCPNGMVMAISKKLVDFTLPFREEYGHDEWLIMCAPLLGKIVTLDDKLAYYRRHSSNTSGNKLNLKAKFKKLDRGGWFLHPGRLSNVYVDYMKRYGDLLDDETKSILEKRLYFDAEFAKIESLEKFGVFVLLKLLFNGIYLMFRGNIKMFVLDELYLMYHVWDYIKAKKHK